MNNFHPAAVFVFFIAMTIPLMLVSSPVNVPVGWIPLKISFLSSIV